MRTLGLIVLLSISAAGCMRNNDQLSDLQVELKAEREMLKETRAELQALIEKLRPLLKLGETLGKEGVTAKSPGEFPPFEEGLRRIGENHYHMKRSLLNTVLSDPDSLSKQARLVPSIKGGKPAGFKIYAIRSGSIFKRLDIRNGDTIRGINGASLDGPEKTLEVFGELRHKRTVEIELVRSGMPLSIQIEIY